MFLVLQEHNGFLEIVRNKELCYDDVVVVVVVIVCYPLQSRLIEYVQFLTWSIAFSVRGRCILDPFMHLELSLMCRTVND